MLTSTFGYANSCAKWFPMPTDGLVVVIPIYDASITEPDLDCDGVIDTLDDDIDGDGVLNGSDAFPLNPSESIDTDGDGIGNNADLDDDNDGYSDADEIAFGSDPLDANDIPVVVSNDGFIVTPLVGTSSQVSFTIALTHKPDSNVTIGYSSADETVAKPTTNTMTFTPDNWYKNQVITVDILNPSSSTEIVFEPTVSSDSSYNGKMLEQVSIVSHQLLLFEPIDKIVYSEFNMSIPVNMAYVGDNEANITVVLDTAPNGMTLDAENARLLWTPALGDEGTDKSVTLTVSDGTLLTKTLSFSLHVAAPRVLNSTISNGILTIADANSTLNGLQIKSMGDAVLSDYRLYGLATSDTPVFREGESVVGEALLIKGNIGKKVQVILPLQGLVTNDELLSFHTKSYYGQGNWRRVDYDYDFNGTLSEPVYVLDTKEFTGVVAFTKVVSGQQVQKSYRATAKSKKAKALSSGVTCSPASYYGTLVDLNNQTCTFVNKPNFVLKIYDYIQSNLFPLDIENIAEWLMDAQNHLDLLSMPYTPKIAIIFEKMNYSGYTSSEPKLYIRAGLFSDIKLIPIASLYLNKDYNIERDVSGTIAHEYFHHSQYNKMPKDFFYDTRDWYKEATATWFEDYTLNNDFYAYKFFEPYNKATIPPILGGGLLLDSDTGKYENYVNGLFFEMLEGHCTDFTHSFKNYFINNADLDSIGFINFTNVSYQLNCDFGTPTGVGNEKRIETKLLYYQYATAIKKDTLLINSQAQKTLNFRNSNPVIKANNWTSSAQSVALNGNWQNSAAQTIKVERVNDIISHCKERYIHFESDNNIMLSIASNDANFPDTPTTMLGDMKQLNFTMNGKYDFTYFYDQNTGKQIYPEMYITMIDIVENPSDTNSYQAVNMSYGIRNKNLLSHLDNKDVCVPMSPITQTAIEAKGVIPYQYRDSNNSARYIDTIRVTDVNTGNTYTTAVQSNDTWVKTISFTFSNNEAPILVEGYNSSDASRIIAREGILVWR